MTNEISIRPIPGIPEILPGMNLADCIIANYTPALNDILVISQKLVSKAESRVVKLMPDDAYIDLICSEAVRVVRRRGDLIITETEHGFICANNGVDRSNIERDQAVLLPKDPDYSAQRIRDRISGICDVDVAVIITDTFGRPWRRGVTDVAIGCAGIKPILDLRGTTDVYGNTLQASEICIVDELASAAELIKGKTTRNGVVLISGGDETWFGNGTVRACIVRPTDEDLFR